MKISQKSVKPKQKSLLNFQIQYLKGFGIIKRMKFMIDSLNKYKTILEIVEKLTSSCIFQDREKLDKFLIDICY